MPSLLKLPTSKLLTYPKESVIAEKFEAMISLGIANSRMKDLHDIRTLSREFPFEGAILSEAIKKTFAAHAAPNCPQECPWCLQRNFSKTQIRRDSGQLFAERIAGMSPTHFCKQCVKR